MGRRGHGNGDFIDIAILTDLGQLVHGSQHRNPVNVTSLLGRGIVNKTNYIVFGYGHTVDLTQQGLARVTRSHNQETFEPTALHGTELLVINADKHT